MTAQFHPGLTLVGTQPACIQAKFTSIKEGSFVSALDDRGPAFLFECLQKPAVFIEVIHTLASKIRGNHVHQHCDETLSVVSGLMDLYLLCSCPERHVFKRTIHSGDTVYTPKGVPHALYALQDTECVVWFDKDPRNDRDRVPILVFH